MSASWHLSEKPHWITEYAVELSAFGFEAIVTDLDGHRIEDYPLGYAGLKGTGTRARFIMIVDPEGRRWMRHSGVASLVERWDWSNDIEDGERAARLLAEFRAYRAASLDPC